MKSVKFEPKEKHVEEEIMNVGKMDFEVKEKEREEILASLRSSTMGNGSPLQMVNNLIHSMVSLDMDVGAFLPGTNVSMESFPPLYVHMVCLTSPSSLAYFPSPKPLVARDNLVSLSTPFPYNLLSKSQKGDTMGCVWIGKTFSCQTWV